MAAVFIGQILKSDGELIDMQPFISSIITGISIMAWLLAQHFQYHGVILVLAETKNRQSVDNHLFDFDVWPM